MSDINSVIIERGKRYGEFDSHAAITQKLKKVFFENGNIYTFAQKEAIEMILHKLGRIANGDPSYKDSWVDIAGYAKLIYDQLED